jgi:hypothetical protein
MKKTDLVIAFALIAVILAALLTGLAGCSQVSGLPLDSSSDVTLGGGGG